MQTYTCATRALARQFERTLSCALHSPSEYNQPLPRAYKTHSRGSCKRLASFEGMMQGKKETAERQCKHSSYKQCLRYTTSRTDGRSDMREACEMAFSALAEIKGLTIFQKPSELWLSDARCPKQQDRKPLQKAGSRVEPAERPFSAPPLLSKGACLALHAFLSHFIAGIMALACLVTCLKVYGTHARDCAHRSIHNPSPVNLHLSSPKGMMRRCHQEEMLLVL